MHDHRFSVLSIGQDHQAISLLVEWNELEAITYLGDLRLDATTDKSLKYPAVSRVEVSGKRLDIILVSPKFPALMREAETMKQPNTLVLSNAHIWLLKTIVDQRLEMKKLYTDQKLFRTILMYSHEGIQFCDENGIIRFVNPSFSRITNIPSEERIGYHIGDVSPEGALYRAYKTKSPVLGHKASGLGSNVETISNAAPIFVDGEFIGAVTTFQDLTEVRYLSQQLLEMNQQKRQTDQNNGHKAMFTFDDIIGESESINDAKDLANKVTLSRSTVLITGESGTGKELFAHAIHSRSPFHDNSFVVVNCASIPPDLLESELFGYEKGAFTGAVSNKLGKIELAKGGTLFLDEIGTMSLPLQAKLLRVLQYKEFERVGGIQKIKADFRIIAATNENLEVLVEKKKFREDLYYRLNVVHLHIPPLRERKADIPLLVEQLMEKISQRSGLNRMQLTNKGIALLYDYDWPGNIRELENFLERVMNMSTTSLIHESLIKENIQKLLERQSRKVKQFQTNTSNHSPSLPLRMMEKKYIKQALDYYGKNLEGKKKAARSLGISISTLYKKVKEYQLD